MEVLSNVIQLSRAELGEKTSVATLIKRDGDIAMYARGTSVFEVFIVQIQEASTVRIGDTVIEYALKEKYPATNVFGKTAWCFTKQVNAEKKFNKLIKTRSNI